jgi:hypothetical protein
MSERRHCIWPWASGMTILISWNNLKRGTDIRTRDNANRLSYILLQAQLGPRKSSLAYWTGHGSRSNVTRNEIGVSLHAREGDPDGASFDQCWKRPMLLRKTIGTASYCMLRRKMEKVMWLGKTQVRKRRMTSAL